MTLLPDHIIAKDKIADIAKGRNNKQQVTEMFQDVARSVAVGSENIGFEFGSLVALQTLHYDFGFGEKRLDRFLQAMQPAITAFDARAYDMDDIKQALREDAHFDFEILYGGNE